MMDRLEKGSGQTVVTLQEAKALIKEDDDLIIAVYDYWLTKRLKTVSATGSGIIWLAELITIVTISFSFCIV